MRKSDHHRWPDLVYRKLYAHADIRPEVLQTLAAASSGGPKQTSYQAQKSVKVLATDTLASRFIVANASELEKLGDFWFMTKPQEQEHQENEGINLFIRESIAIIVAIVFRFVFM